MRASHRRAAAAGCGPPALRSPLLAPCRLRLSTLFYALAFIAGGASTAYLTSLRFSKEHSYATHISISGSGGWSRKGLYISTGAPRRGGR